MLDEFRMVRFGQLCESDTNPRQHYNQQKLEELAESVREKGILEPLLVRPIPPGRWIVQPGIDEASDLWYVTNDTPIGGTESTHILRGAYESREIALSMLPEYEIVAGARRYRAGIIAEALEAPVRVRDYSDAEALDVQVIENLQREDVHPMDEAVGFRTLIERGGATVADIALRIGKKPDYVATRLKLCDLVESARAAYWDGHMLLGHALEISRLSPEYQEELLTAMLCRSFTVGQLKQHIREKYCLDLEKAVFKTDATDLLKKVGSCIECPKRTGYHPELWPDIEHKDTCTDPSCYAAKAMAHLDLLVAASKKAGVKTVKISSNHIWNESMRQKGVAYRDEYQWANKGSCDHSVAAIMVEGSDIGKIKWVCKEQTCKTHWKNPRYVKTEEEKAADRAAKLLAKKKDRTKMLFIEAVAKVTTWPFTREDMEIVLSSTLARAWEDTMKYLCKYLEIKPEKKQYNTDYITPVVAYANTLSTEDLARLIITVSLIQSEHVLQNWITERKVDMAEISAQVEHEFAVPEKKTAKKSTKKPAPVPTAEIAGE